MSNIHEENRNRTLQLCRENNKQLTWKELLELSKRANSKVIDLFSSTKNYDSQRNKRSIAPKLKAQVSFCKISSSENSSIQQELNDLKQITKCIQTNREIQQKFSNADYSIRIHSKNKLPNTSSKFNLLLHGIKINKHSSNIIEDEIFKNIRNKNEIQSALFINKQEEIMRLRDNKESYNFIARNSNKTHVIEECVPMDIEVQDTYQFYHDNQEFETMFKNMKLDSFETIRDKSMALNISIDNTNDEIKSEEKCQITKYESIIKNNIAKKLIVLPLKLKFEFLTELMKNPKMLTKCKNIDKLKFINNIPYNFEEEKYELNAIIINNSQVNIPEEISLIDNIWKKFIISNNAKHSEELRNIYFLLEFCSENNLIYTVNYFINNIENISEKQLSIMNKSFICNPRIFKIILTKLLSINENCPVKENSNKFKKMLLEILYNNIGNFSPKIFYNYLM